MASLKALMLLAAVAVSLSLLVEVKANLLTTKIQHLCIDLKQEVNAHVDLKLDGDLVQVMAERWLEDRTSQTQVVRDLLAAWHNIYSGKECSSNSWNDLLLMNACQSVLELEILDKPIKVYTEKCITSKNTSERIRTEASSKAAKSVDLLDTAFIKKYYEENPHDRPLHVDWVGIKFWFKGKNYFGFDQEMDRNCCRPMRSIGALIDAINRDLNKQGDNGKQASVANNMLKYLEDKLYYPCEAFVYYYRDLASQFEMVTKYYYYSEKRDLIQALDQDAKDIFFRYKYCEMLNGDKEKLTWKVSDAFQASKV